ncbi:hypothetical protein ACK8HX_05320 [Oryzobacter sp. R7]|uniref:hypothetical protein n=1 Tax=Oryzobacter faecalis TaxID=3388656 RepID=UPI00398D659D
MPVLAFPGPQAPPPPAVTVEVPDGWEPVPAGPDLLRARGAGTVGDPIEVGVGTHRAAVGALAEQVVEEVSTASAPEGSEVEPVFVVEIGGREWAARNVSWDEPGGPVVEVVLATSPDGSDDAAPFVVATGRVRGSGVDDDYDVLQGVLETIVVGAGA